jgi:hypothetical protein
LSDSAFSAACQAQKFLSKSVGWIPELLLFVKTFSPRTTNLTTARLIGFPIDGSLKMRVA